MENAVAQFGALCNPNVQAGVIQTLSQEPQSRNRQVAAVLLASVQDMDRRRQLAKPLKADTSDPSVRSLAAQALTEPRASVVFARWCVSNGKVTKN